MEEYYKISIPEPCDENWNKMRPNHHGRFCGSCEKTVIDFTKLSEMQMENFLIKNKDQNICGHFKKTQLDGIHLSIPVEVIRRSYTFRKAFLLALVIAMGSTLFNCTQPNGNQHKIDSVQIVEQQQNNMFTKTTYNTTQLPIEIENDTLKKIKGEVNSHKKPPLPVIKKLSIPETIEGELVVMGIPEYSSSTSLNEPIPFTSLDIPPSFTEISGEKRTKENFQQQVKKLVSKEFDTTIAASYGLYGLQRIYTQFEINKDGLIQNIKVRAPHPSLDKEARRVLQKIPKLKPGSYKNNKVTTIYSLPIIFKIEQ